MANTIKINQKEETALKVEEVAKKLADKLKFGVYGGTNSNDSRVYVLINFENVITESEEDANTEDDILIGVINGVRIYGNVSHKEETIESIRKAIEEINNG